MDSRNAGDCPTCEPTRNQFRVADAPVADSCRSGTCPRSDRQDKSIAERRWNGSPCLQECLQVRLRRLLKSQNSFASVASMCMTTGQQFRLGNPRPAFITAYLNLGGRNNHDADRISERPQLVNVSAVARVARHKLANTCESCGRDALVAFSFEQESGGAPLLLCSAELFNRARWLRGFDTCFVGVVSVQNDEIRCLVFYFAIGFRRMQEVRWFPLRVAS